MTQGYQGQSGLLLEVLRIAAKSEVVALKGGTAINFFFQDCPRLSVVDIDLCYLPLSGRDEAFRDIRENMEAIKSEIEQVLEEGSEPQKLDSGRLVLENTWYN